MIYQSQVCPCTVLEYCATLDALFRLKENTKRILHFSIELKSILHRIEGYTTFYNRIEEYTAFFNRIERINLSDFTMNLMETFNIIHF